MVFEQVSGSDMKFEIKYKLLLLKNISQKTSGSITIKNILFTELNRLESIDYFQESRAIIVPRFRNVSTGSGRKMSCPRSPDAHFQNILRQPLECVSWDIS